MQQVAALNIDINANGASSNSTDSSSGGAGKAFDSMLQQQQSSSDNAQSSANPPILAEAKPVQKSTTLKEKDQYVAEPVNPEPSGSHNAKQSEIAAEAGTNESVQKEAKLANPAPSNDAESQRPQNNQAEQAHDAVLPEELDLAELPSDPNEEPANPSFDWLDLIEQADAQKLDKKPVLNDEDLLFIDDISKQDGQIQDQDLQALAELLERWHQQQEKDPELSRQLANIFQQLSTGSQQSSAQLDDGNTGLETDQLRPGLNSEANLKLLSELMNTEPDKPASETVSEEDLLATDNLQAQLLTSDIEQDTAGLKSNSAIEVINLGNPEKPDTALNLLTAMPEEKLDKALNNLAERLAELENNNQVKQLDLELQQKTDVNVQANAVLNQNVVAKSAKTNLEYADFISSLKAGIAEYKQQLQQGHQPAIDLSALVNEAIITSGQFAQLSPEKLEQQLKPFSQMLDLSQSINSSLDVLATESTRRENVAAQEVSRNEAKQSINQPLLDKAVNITKPEGHQQLAERVRWMVGNNLTQADIRLDPPDMGSMQIKVSMHGEAASVSFVVQSQQARDMLDQAVPRLRELLGEKGIELGESQIHQQNQSAGEQAQQNTNGQHADAQPEVTEEHLVAEQSLRNGHLGGIDYFV